MTKPAIDLDIRYFKRYPTEIIFSLNIKNRSFQSKVLDYSFQGLGIIVKDPMPLQIGDVIDLNIDELNIHQKGKVQWIKKHDSYLRAGILRIGDLSGSLKHYSLSDILMGFQKTLRTGILDIKSGSIHKEIYIKHGNMIFATSNQDKDGLWHVLLKYRIISKEQYAEAIEFRKKTGKSIAAVLVALGYLKPKELKSVVELQAKSIIGSLFVIGDAAFEFKEGSVSLKDIVTLKLSVANLIYGEVKRTADVKLLEKYFLDSIIEFSPTPLNLFQDISLETGDKTILSLVDGRTKVRDIIQLSPLVQDDTLKTIYALLEARILEIKKEGESPQGITVEEVLEEVQETPRETIEKIETMYAKCKNANNYDLLGVPRGATDYEIRKAYYKAAKEFHPDLNFSLSKDMKNKLIEIFTYMTNAYLSLKESENRKQYEDSAEPWQPRSARVIQNPEIAKAKFIEGKNMYKKGDCEYAAHCFASALYFDKSVPQYYYYYGCSLAKLEKWKDAVKVLNEYLELNPNSPNALAELGHIYLKLHFPLRAEGYFNKAMQLNPANKRAKEGIALIGNG
jgi:tetratricopeptide (TPR) repeat protein